MVKGLKGFNGDSARSLSHKPQALHYLEVRATLLTNYICTYCCTYYHIRAIKGFRV